MIRVLSNNITSPLGMTTEENYQALLSGRSMLSTYQGWMGLAEPFAASMFTDAQKQQLQVEGYSRFESLVICSVADALSRASLQLTDRVVFILSTTKCNVEELEDKQEGEVCGYLHPGETARKIARYFGLTTEPIVVSNACISGVSAQIVAQRLIEAGLYDSAIVCGADCVTQFIVGGFQSFKALSPYACRPYDIDRLGLNVGEAAATIIYDKVCGGDVASWLLERGCMNNDAYHVSAPSPSGDGTYRAIKNTLQDVAPKELGVVSVHGTATMFNDQMESKAIERAALSDVMLSAIKGYYGHTMGAAGLIETIITMRSLDDGKIVASRGFEEIGVSGKVSISNQMQLADKQRFLKIISGFGGCNGALLLSKGTSVTMPVSQPVKMQEIHRVQLIDTSLMIDGKTISTTSTGKELLTEIYKQYIGNYPKFYKMDMLSRLAFVASELLIQQETEVVKGEERAIVLFNATTSIDSDRKHIETIRETGIASPSVFLYTLPNIMLGEIAIKHQYQGETSLYLLTKKDEALMQQIIDSMLLQQETKSLLTGWVDCRDEHSFEADIRIITQVDTER